MVSQSVKERDRIKKERVKSAVESAMAGQWNDAVEINRALLEDHPDELETYNRLGKALGELGHNREAREAFQKALELSPHNSIAKKNLERLARLADETPASPEGNGSGTPRRHAFIEESGRAAVTELMKLGPAEVLLKVSPGRSLKLTVSGKALKVTTATDEYVGQVEPRIASRLLRLMDGGNVYEAAVTGVDERELHIIIRESYKHPSQARIVSFPGRRVDGSRLKAPRAVLGYELGDEDGRRRDMVGVKDWSNDDTEPGDDDAYSPVVHRIINSSDDTSEEITEDF